MNELFGTHRNVYCIGRNYAEHARELNNETPSSPVVFLKAQSALRALDSGETAHRGETFHHEAEVVVHVGRDVALGARGSWDLIDGVGLGLDLTRRDVQSRLKEKGLPWTIAKSFMGAAPISPFLSTDQFRDLNKIKFIFAIAGDSRQSGDTSDMIFPVPELLTFLLQANELKRGDVIFTGTPKGVGPIRHGDAFELRFLEPEVAWRGTL